MASRVQEGGSRGVSGGSSGAGRVGSKSTAKERGFAKDKASRKEMKEQDVFYAKIAKEDLKSGKIGISKSVLSKSQSPSKPKVPVKKVGKK